MTEEKDSAIGTGEEAWMGDRNQIQFINASIWCGSPVRMISGSMRIKGPRIAEVREDTTKPGKVLPNAVDLQGMHIIPGLIDAHRHFFVGAMLSLSIDASWWTSKEDALYAIHDACWMNRADKRWAFFTGMDHTKWKDMRLPTLKEIDAAAAGYPVFIPDISFHRALVSSGAMIRAGISRKSMKIPSDIDVSWRGAATGLVWEDAVGRVFTAMFQDMREALGTGGIRKLVVEEAGRLLASGITHVHDPGLPWDVQQLLKGSRQDTRLKMSWSITNQDSLFSPPVDEDEEQSFQSDHAPKSVKFFLDGAHRTAGDVPLHAALRAMARAGIESFAHRGTKPLKMMFDQKIVLSRGRVTTPYLRFRDSEELIMRARFFTERGYRLVMHALGNTAARQAADIVGRLRPVGGASVEHLAVLGERDMDIFAGCGAVASIQPGFIPFYAHLFEAMGVIPYLKPFPLKSLSDRGVAVCISSDGPCAGVDPLHNIRRAVDRRRLDDTVFVESEAITKEQALTAASIGGSLSMGNRNDGLVTGAPATFCIVSGDPFLDTSSVVQTWIDGRRVY